MTAAFGGFAGSLDQLTQLPGLRTFRSARFRVLVGLLLLAVSFAMAATLVVIVTGEPAGAQTVGAKMQVQYGIDFRDYRTASLRMVEGRSPYAPEMFEGPIPAQGVDRYRYPPTFAQVLTPLAVLPFVVGATLWLVIQALCLFAACWLAGSLAGLRPSPERLVWTGVVLAYFLPVFAALWLGNVGGPMALTVALLLGSTRVAGRGIAAGFSGAAAVVLKVVPVVALPAIARFGGRVLGGALVGLGILVLPSIALLPQAWLDYARVFPNLAAGSAVYANNLAPATVLLNAGAPQSAVDAMRVVTLLAAGALVTASVLAARSEGWAFAVSSVTAASLLVPSALWYHYLVLLLPIAFFAWGRSQPAGRFALLVAGALVTLGQAAFPIATLGGALLAGGALWILRPRRPDPWSRGAPKPAGATA